MVQVNFFDPDHIPADKLIYSVIAARYLDKWVFVRHHQRTTFEIAGGHIEEGESPINAARRELAEETGAKRFSIFCVATYSVTKETETRYGKLYYAEISDIGPVPDNSEIEEIAFMETLPVEVTYPDIQPLLFKKVVEFLKSGFNN